jgi:hypothetical protein
MTLAQAQKRWDDAVEIRFKHIPCRMKEIPIEYDLFDAQILFMSIGKTSGRIIYSRKAAMEDAVKKNKKQEKRK